MCALYNNKKAYFMQHAQCMLLFLVLMGNFALFHILCSYTLLFQSPVLMHSWCGTCVEPHPVYTICEACILCSVCCLRNTVWPAISIRAHFFLFISLGRLPYCTLLCSLTQPHFWGSSPWSPSSPRLVSCTTNHLIYVQSQEHSSINIQTLAYLSEACVASQHYAHISVSFHQSLVQQQ